MSDKGINKLSEAIIEAIKDDKNHDYEEYYSDIQFNREGESKGGRAPADLNKRKLQIFDCDDSFEHFLIEQYKQNGIKNVFGEPIAQFQRHLYRPKDAHRPPLLPPLKPEKEEKSYSKPMKLVDAKITTHHVGQKTYFVLTGFKKGMQM